MQLNLVALDRLLGSCWHLESSKDKVVTEHFRADYGIGRSVSSVDGFTRWRYDTYDRYVEPLGAVICGDQLSGTAWCNRRLSIQPQLAWDVGYKLGVSVHWVRGFRRGWVDSEKQSDWHESNEHIAGFEHAKVFAKIWPEYRFQNGNVNWESVALVEWRDRQQQWHQFRREQAGKDRQQKMARNQQLAASAVY